VRLRGWRESQHGWRPGFYVLTVLDEGEILEGEFQGEATIQIRHELEIAEGPNAGYRFFEYFSLDPVDGTMRANSKYWDVYEAVTRRKLAEDDEVDSADLVGGQFQAQVVIAKTGKRNRTEHGSIGPYRPKKGQSKEEPKAEEPNDRDEKEFEDIPF
jgi:hypothetical protein